MRYALEKRTARQFTLERLKRLIVPYVAGILLVTPAQSYFAERFHNGYTDGFFEQYSLFFSKYNSATDYYGGFTHAHLWFIIALFSISMLALGIFLLTQHTKQNTYIKTAPYWSIALLFILVWIFTPILEIGGKQYGKYFVLFLIGLFVLSDDTVQQKLEARRFISLIILLICEVVQICIYYGLGINGGSLYNLSISAIGYFGILTIFGFARHSLDYTNKAFSYFARCSFSIYILHQTFLVAIAYYVVSCLPTLSHYVQYAIITLGSFAVTIAAYEIIRRIPYFRVLFGIKEPLQIKAASVSPK